MKLIRLIILVNLLLVSYVLNMHRRGKTRKNSLKNSNSLLTNETSESGESLSRAIMSRLSTYENKLYNFLLNIGVLPQSKDTTFISNTDILSKLEDVLKNKMDLKDVKSVKEELDKSLANFFKALQKYGEFKVSNNG